MELRAEQAKRNQEALEKRLQEEEAERIIKEEEDRKLAEHLAIEAKFVPSYSASHSLIGN